MVKHLLLGLTALSLTACSLDIKNESEISGDNVINTTQKATSVLAQAYRELPIDSRTFTMLSEDLQPTYLLEYNSNEKQYYIWEERALTTNASSMWDSYYSTIVHLNTILHTEENIRDKSVEWNYIKGNTLALKAYVYFDLLQLYSDRYTPNSPGVLRKDKLEIETNKRLTQKESIDYINTLLKEGLSLMKDYPNQKGYFITYKAAKQLEAKIALHTRQYSEVEHIITEIIQDGTSLPNTPEAYRALWQNKDVASTNQLYWSYDFMNNPNEYLRTQETGDIMHVNYLNEFKDTDIRYTVSQYNYIMKTAGNDKGLRVLLGKYKTNYDDREQRKIVLSRYTESHFILIESLIEQNKLKEATERLNEFLTSVNSGLIDNNQTQQSLRLIFRAEKQKEFIGEKVNFFDLKRWNIEIARYQSESNKKLSTIVATDFRWTWPLPLAEIRHNPNIVQNNGWPSVE
jgi:hypothetical protein